MPDFRSLSFSSHLLVDMSGGVLQALKNLTVEDLYRYTPEELLYMRDVGVVYVHIFDQWYRSYQETLRLYDLLMRLYEL